MTDRPTADLAAQPVTAETLMLALERIYIERDFFGGNEKRAHAAAVVDSMDFVKLFASRPVEEEGLRARAARFVATYWRDAYMVEHAKGEAGYWAIGTHPLAMVLAALDGETDPTQLGISEDQHEAFRSALAPTNPNDV